MSDIWHFSPYNGIRNHNHLVGKRKPKQLDKLAK